MPPHLAADDLARAAWQDIAARLLAQNVLTTGHGELLALIADAWAQYVRLRLAFAKLEYQSVIVQEWKQRGRTMRRFVENPLCRQLRQQALLLNSLFGEFGQTPASAPKVHASADGPDPLERFLSAGPDTNVVAFAKRKRARASAS